MFYDNVNVFGGIFGFPLAGGGGGGGNGGAIDVTPGRIPVGLVGGDLGDSHLYQDVDRVYSDKALTIPATQSDPYALEIKNAYGCYAKLWMIHSNYLDWLLLKHYNNTSVNLGWRFNGSYITHYYLVGSPSLFVGPTSATIPTLRPDYSTPKTGIGAAANDQLSLISNAKERVRIAETSTISGDIAGNNYNEIAGHIRSYGTNIIWKEHVFNPEQLGSAVSEPDKIIFRSGPSKIYGFDGLGTLEDLYSNDTLRNEMVPGSDLYPFVNWCPTSTGTGQVIWWLYYEFLIYGATTPHTPVTISITTSSDGNEWAPKKEWFPIIANTGFGFNAIYTIRIWRDPSTETGGYSDDAGFFNFGFAYKSDMMGSVSRTGKYS